MADYSDLKLALLDELCDKLDESGIEGNVIERDSCGNPYVNIWYGKYTDRKQQLSEMFTVVVTDHSYFASFHGSYEIKPPIKYYACFHNIFKAFERKNGFYVMSSDQIIRVVKRLFDIETSIRKEELNKENNMNKDQKREEAISSLIHELDIRKMNWASMGVFRGYPTIRICNIYAIADIHVLATNSEYVYAIEPLTTKFRDHLKNSKYRYARTYPCTNDWYVYITVRTVACVIKDFLDTDTLLSDPEPKIFDKLYAKEVIFNDPATIVMWSDGSKTVVKANGEKFDPEKGLAMAISKRMLGNKHNYYDFFKKHIGRYEKKQAKKAKKEN